MIEGRKVNIKNRVTVSVESDLNEIFDIFENKNKQEIDELRKGMVFLMVLVILEKNVKNYEILKIRF